MVTTIIVAVAGGVVLTIALVGVLRDRGGIPPAEPTAESGAAPATEPRRRRRHTLHMLHQEAKSPSGEYTISWPNPTHALADASPVNVSVRKGDKVAWQDQVLHPGHCLVTNDGAAMIVTHAIRDFRSGVRLYDPYGDLLMSIDFRPGIPEFGLTRDHRFAWCAISPSKGKTMTRGRIMLFGVPDCDRVVAFPDIRNTHGELRGRIRDIRLSDFHATLHIEGGLEATCDFRGNIVTENV